VLRHPDTLFTVHALDYQERLRDAAQERRAASAHSGEHHRGGVAWIGEVFSRLRGVGRAWGSRPVMTDPAQPAHRVS
jgi:hypothetical protein